jgi:hypothetical protein
MSLTPFQARGLAKISRQFKRIEKLSAENNIDLEIFVNRFSNTKAEEPIGEQSAQGSLAKRRSSLFEKSGSQYAQTPADRNSISK